MFFIGLVMVANVMINPLAGMKSKTIAEYDANFLLQFEQPVIEYTYKVNS